MNTFDPEGRVLAAELTGKIDCEVMVSGRLLAVRCHGKIAFLDLFDRSGKMQLVMEITSDPVSKVDNGDPAPRHCHSPIPEELATDAIWAGLPAIQSVIVAHGRVTAASGAPHGVEIRVNSLTVLSEPTAPLPFNPAAIVPPLHSQGPNLETVLDHRVISFRAPANFALLRVTAGVLQFFADFCRTRGFTEIKTSKLVEGGTEGGANMFEVRYFDRVAYLAQSPQLFKQALASTLVERVFEIGPAFRSEKHDSTRHLNEFTGLDIELSYPHSMFTLMAFQEEFLHGCVAHLRNNHAADLELLGVTLPQLAGSFPRISLDEAKTIATGTRPTRSRPAEDMSQEDERAVCAWAAQEHGCDAVFVHSFPSRNRPFYTMPLPENPRKSSSFDLLLRGLEISSGSIRIHDPAILEQNLRRLDLDPEQFADYLQIFRSGCPPHGGFGIGLERLVSKLLDLPNVRYATPFPRDRNRLAP